MGIINPSELSQTAPHPPENRAISGYRRNSSDEQRDQHIMPLQHRLNDLPLYRAKGLLLEHLYAAVSIMRCNTSQELVRTRLRVKSISGLRSRFGAGAAMV